MTRPTDVYLFGTCLLDLFLPEAGLDAIALLERLGMRVHYPQAQSCCGQPAYTSGHPGQALAVARAQLACFPEDWPIVVPSGSCGGMIKHHWPRLFAGEADEAAARAVAARVAELSDFLLNRLDWRPDDVGPPVTVAVHTSCSARREMDVHQSCWTLLDRLRNVERVVHDHESECCGFGGTFSIKHPDIAGAMVTDKARSLRDSGAVAFVTADAGCLLNINGKLGQCGDAFHGRHLASFLLERTGGRR
ncbi:oxidoreductase [Chromobacterium sp. ATCC 53434]|uniref:(Fe-S)-binding protein n=1 Tax=Chromobacterium sp. (strain ATCC 53434 / SC 14030) TaxID=2059672 RepID=UPI000C763A09|nr:(Fe-S)-binding protein [Chromobacterium sp. ATCC 53434]AUH50455.1 oxidoreductase [Chromobacterium sp. ATCC 53434]